MTQKAVGPSVTGRCRPWLLALGILLTAVSGIYLVRYAAKYQAELRTMDIRPSDISWAATACALYCSALLCSAIGWLGAARACGASTHGPTVVSVALVSQIGKYAPGNVAHHIGRVVFAGSRGMPFQLVAKSTLFELASAVVAGGVVALICGALSFRRADHVLLGLIPTIPAWVLAIGGALVIAICGLRFMPRVSLYREVLSLKLPAAAITLLAHVLSATLAGLSFYAVVRAVAAPGVDPLYCVALFAIAWLAGFVTPGAPAGLGVRETILLVGLSSVLGPLSLWAAITHRLVSALSDALMAGGGAMALRLPVAKREGAL